MHPALHRALARIDLAAGHAALLPGAALAAEVDTVFEETSRVRGELVADRSLRTAEADALSSALLRFARAVERALALRSGPAGWLARARVRRRLRAGLLRWRAERVATITYPYGRFLRGRVA